MRTIKYRGKSLYDKFQKVNGGFEIPKGAFVYGNLIVDLNGKPKINIQGYIDGNGFQHDVWVDEDTVGQFTGLLDKNGKEIYEGDIVSLDAIAQQLMPKVPVFGIVSWIDNGFWYQYPYNNKDGKRIYTNLCHLSLEVIGNIHDNPELLKL